MRYTINHELPQRIRLTITDRIPLSDAAALEPILASWAGIERVRVYPRIRSVAIWSRNELTKTAVLGRLNALTPEQLSAAGTQAPGALAPVDVPVVRSIARLAGSYLMRRWFMPPALRTIWAGIHYLGFLRAGLASLAHGRLDVPVLDASAIGLSFAKRDPKTLRAPCSCSIWAMRSRTRLARNPSTSSFARLWRSPRARGV